MRLTVDLRRLNKMVERRLSTNPTVWDTFRALDPSSSIFAVCDLLHSYFQIRLSAQAKPFFCFHSAQYGIMTFSGAVQGFIGSSDELIATTDVALAGLKIKKMMDDILVEGASIKELVERSRALFERCQKRKLYF